MNETAEKKGPKRKVCNVNWSREMITKLIELYESHSNLWDCSLECYKNRNARKTSIEAIANAMQISIQEVNDKIHNLRCQFQSINRKRKKTKSGQAAGDNFIVKWEFYEALKFIDGPISGSNEITIDSMAGDGTVDESQHNLSDDQQSNLSNHNEHVLQDYSSSDTSRCSTPMASTSHAFTPSSSTFLNTISTPSRLTAKKKKDQEQALLNQCLGVMSKTADSFEVFGDYVADELRTMSSKAPDLQSHAKREIQRIILDMNDRYESRLQNNIASQSQMSRNKEPSISHNNIYSQSHQISVKKPTQSESILQNSSSSLQAHVNDEPKEFGHILHNNPLPIPVNEAPIETEATGVTQVNQNDDMSIVHFYQTCGTNNYLNM